MNIQKEGGKAIKHFEKAPIGYIPQTQIPMAGVNSRKFIDSWNKDYGSESETEAQLHIPPKPPVHKEHHHHKKTQWHDSPIASPKQKQFPTGGKSPVFHEVASPLVGTKPSIDLPVLSADSNMVRVVSTTPAATYQTPEGSYVSNVKNGVLFSAGLPISFAMQWISTIEHLCGPPKNSTLYYTIPAQEIASSVHGIILDPRRQQNSGTEGGFKMKGYDGIGNEQFRSHNSPGLGSDGTNIKKKRNENQNGRAQEATNILTPLGMSILKQNRMNHNIQILQVSLLGFSNPLPVPVGIKWEANESAHCENFGGTSYLFILEPESVRTLSEPRTWDLRPKLNADDTQLGAIYQREQAGLGLSINPANPNADFTYVYKFNILYEAIIRRFGGHQFEETVMDTKPVIIVSKVMAEEAHCIILQNIESVQFLTYSDFSFSITPLVNCTRGSADHLPQSTRSENVLKLMFEQKHKMQISDCSHILQLVHANISFRYL